MIAAALIATFVGGAIAGAYVGYSIGTFVALLTVMEPEA